MQYRFPLILAVLALSLLATRAHASYAYNTTFNSPNPAHFGASSAVTFAGSAAQDLAGSTRLVLTQLSLATTQSPAHTDRGSVPFSIAVTVTDPSASFSAGTLVVAGAIIFSRSDTGGEASTLCCAAVSPASITVNGSLYSISPDSLSYAAPAVNSTAAGDIEATLDVTIPTSLIHGVVFPDSTGARRADPGVPPLRGVAVDLRDPATGNLLDTTTTGSGGDFSFSVIPPGSYDVALDLPAGQVVTLALPGSSGRARAVGDHLQVTLARGESADGLFFLLRSLVGPTISGSVWRGSRSACQPAASDQPIPDLLLRLLDTTGHEVVRTFTLADGRYFFALPPPGPGYLVVPALPAMPLPGAGAQVAGSSALVIPALAANQNYPNNNFLAARGVSAAGPASLEGYAIAASSRARQTVPLAGVIVQLHDASGQLLARASSGAEGLFFFTNLPIGTYSLEQVPLPGYAPATAVPGQNGSPGAGGTLQVAMVPGLNDYGGSVFVELAGLAPTAANSVSGTVTGTAGSGGGPRAGTVLILEQFLPGLPGDACRPAGEGVTVGVASTDSAGHYQFTNVGPGTYRVVVLGPLGSGAASPGPGAATIDGHTLQVTPVAGVTQYPGNDFTLSP